MQKKRARIAWIALVALALASLGLAAGAQAKLTGEFTKFANCEYKNTEVKKCIYSVTESGEVVLGKKAVPIEKQVILQGGYGKAVEGFSKFFGATNGITLSKAPQNVPGGLLGIVPEAESPALVKALIKFFLENKLTGLNATLELAKSASEIRVGENHLAGEFDTALEMPVKVHLENPFLGKNCYVGSSTSPIVWKLTTGTTAPPEPNKPITGSAGSLEVLEEGAVAKLTGTKLVDNAWSAPKASGCGGILGFLVNPIVNTQLGTITAGHNTAILKNTIYIGSAFATKENDETHP
jgi:hypothetical protein